MENEQEAQFVSFLSGFLCSATIGAGVGLLIAPGSEWRRGNGSAGRRTTSGN